MARNKMAPDVVGTRHQLAARLRAVRVELHGERGGPEMARLLGIPPRTWYNYEVGVTVPAEVLLRFLEVTGTEPRWLLHGEGPLVRPRMPTGPEEGGPARAAGVPPAGLVESLLIGALQRLGRGELRIRWGFQDVEDDREAGERRGPGPR